MRRFFSNTVLLTLLTFAFTTSCTKIEIDPKAPQIGSYFYSDGTFSYGDTPEDTKECIGIVFSNTYGSDHKTMIVSLKESTDKWCIKDTIVKKNSKTDGLVNLNTIKTYENWETIFPAFKWVSDLGEGWYLPAKDELTELYSGYNKNKALFNRKMELAGGVEFHQKWYWSSSDDKKIYSWVMSFAYGGSTSVGRQYADNISRGVKVVKVGKW